MAIWPEANTVEQQIFLLVIYGYFIFSGSKLLAEGCDILRDIYGAGLVGSIVIPILGAIPDVLIVLFSGIKDGTQEEIQAQLNVGVGALAGATIMLITVPLCISVFIGSRQLDEEGRAMSEYRPITKGSSKLVLKPVVPTRFNIFANGVTALPSTARGAKWMLVTCSTFLFIQIPAFFYSSDEDGGASHELRYAIAGCIASTLFFFAYLYTMWDDTDHLDLIEERRQRVHKFMLWSQQNRTLIGTLDPVTLFNLLDKDQDGMLDAEDLRLGFKTMGLVLSHAEAQAFFNMMRSDSGQDVDIGEFVSFVKEFILSNEVILPPSGPDGSVGSDSQAGLTSTTPVMQAVKDRVLREHRARRDSFSLDPLAPGITPRPRPYSRRHSRSNSVSFEPSVVRSSSPALDRSIDVEFSVDMSNVQGEGGDSEKIPLMSQSHQHPSQVSLSSGSRSRSGSGSGKNFRKFHSDNTSYGTYEAAPSRYQQSLPSLSSAWDLTLSSGRSSGGSDSRDRDYGNPDVPFEPQQTRDGVNVHHLDLSQDSRNGSLLQDRGNFVSDQFLSQSSPSTSFSPLRNDADENSAFQAFHAPPPSNPGSSRETVIDLYTDLTRREEPIEKNSLAPPIPPDLMQLLIKWFVDPDRRESVLIRVGTKLRWSLHLWATRTGRLVHFSTTDPYTNERVLKLCKNTASSSHLNIQHPYQHPFTYPNSHNHHNTLSQNQAPSHVHQSPYGVTKAKAYSIDNQSSNSNSVHGIYSPSNSVMKTGPVKKKQKDRSIFSSFLFSQLDKKGNDKRKEGTTPSRHLGDADQWNDNEMPLRASQQHLLSSQRSFETTLDSQNKNTTTNDYAIPPSSTSPSNLRPDSVFRLGSFDRIWLNTDLPRWASASDEILHFVRQRPGCSVQTIFAEADMEKRGTVSLTNLLAFSAKFGLNIPSHAMKILFFANDADHDRALTVMDFKHFLESLVHVPEEFEQLDKLMRDVEDQNLEEELELAGLGPPIDPHSHLHMHGWSEKRKKLYGIGLLVVSISIVAFFSDPMIEVMTAFSNNIQVKPFYISFVVTPFVSNASEVIASLMFARAKTNVSMGLTLSSLYGAVTMNNTLCMAVFLALIAIRGLAWRYTAEVLTIITVEVIVAFMCMRDTLKQWQALVIGSLFPLSILMVYFLEEVLGVNG